jgi:cobalamin biosynthesis Co2+ chelatase CbiK
MTTASITNRYPTKAMQQSIRSLEHNGFTVRRILPVDLMAGIHAREFCADFAKPTKFGLLVFSVRIDTDGNVSNPNH